MVLIANYGLHELPPVKIPLKETTIGSESTIKNRIDLIKILLFESNVRLPLLTKINPAKAIVREQ